MPLSTVKSMSIQVRKRLTLVWTEAATCFRLGLALLTELLPIAKIKGRL